MKHWDLFPGETVTLRSAQGDSVAGRFLGRDTIRARFLVGVDVVAFELRDDGSLIEIPRAKEEVVHIIAGGGPGSGCRADREYHSSAAVRQARERRQRRVWTIEGEERGSRVEWPQ